MLWNYNFLLTNWLIDANYDGKISDTIADPESQH